MEGDDNAGCVTIPIKFGTRVSNAIVILLCILTMSLLGYVQYMQISDDKLSFFYILIFIQFPLVFLTYKVAVSKVKKDFAQASLLTQVIMLSGVFYMPVFYNFITSSI